MPPAAAQAVHLLGPGCQPAYVATGTTERHHFPARPRRRALPLFRSLLPIRQVTVETRFRCNAQGIRAGAYDASSDSQRQLMSTLDITFLHGVYRQGTYLDDRLADA